MKFLSLLVVVVALASMASAGEVSKKMLKKIAMHNFFSSCWGKNNMKMWYKEVKSSVKKCQGLTPTFDLGIFEDKKQQFGPFSPSQPSAPVGFDRNNLNINNPYEAWMAFLAFQQSQQGAGRRYRREVKVPTPEEIAEFKTDILMYKQMKMQNLGNLTCVLADMGVLDANLEINLDYFTRDMWQMPMDEPIDPDFKDKLIECAQDCHAIAQSIPQSILDKNPIYKKLGRHLIFFKCQAKSEVNLCAKQEISRYYEDIYGPPTSEKLAMLGLPQDKFDAAYMSKKVMMSSMADSEKFVYKFIMTGQAS